MKLYFYLILLFSLSCNAYADNPTSVRLNYDSASAHNANGVSVLIDVGNPKPKSLLVSLGFSANEIESDLALAAFGRKRIYPVYGFAKLSVNHTIAPFFEIGMDLGDAFIDNLFGGEGEIIDAYYTLGVTLAMSKNIGVSFFRKRYDIEFYEAYNPKLQKVDLNMSGISFSYYIK